MWRNHVTVLLLRDNFSIVDYKFFNLLYNYMVKRAPETAPAMHPPQADSITLRYKYIFLFCIQLIYTVLSLSVVL